MQPQDNTPFALQDPEFFIPIESRPPSPELRRVVESVLSGDGWTVIPGGVWTSVHPRGVGTAPSGWKLHVSTLPAAAETVLARVAAVLRDDPVPFKFASDRRILDLIHTRNWPRAGGGKFITIYPADEAHFRRLASALAEATREFVGPYILTDRRVPDSNVVFYRFGEHLAAEEVSPQGERVPRVYGPAGQAKVDDRAGYYQLPEWEADPYGARPVRVLDGTGPAITLAGRYRVRGSLRYTNLGGVYRAVDETTGQTVVIRERRPFYGWVTPEHDCIALLDSEAAILRCMEGSGVAPAFVDRLRVWEHEYLVMEHVSGMSLRDYASGQFLRGRGIASPRRLFWTFRRLLLRLLEGVEAFHAAGIILRDLTPGNILVRPDRSLCFIDLEFAWMRDGDVPPMPGVHTPGFASPAQVAGEAPSEADDWYAVGAMIVEMCACIGAGLALDRDAALRTTAMMMEEVGLPPALLDAARGLLETDPARRWGPGEVRRALADVAAADVPWTAPEPGRYLRPGSPACAPQDTVERAALAAREVCEFLEASADPESARALWPGTPRMHHTNPVSVLHGAAGPLELVRRVRGRCPDAWLDWVEARARPGACPPGLFAGLAGVALALDDCGRTAAARGVLADAMASPLRTAEVDLYHGAAGVGLAALTLAARHDDGDLAAFARDTGAWLHERAQVRGQNVAWPAADGSQPCGLARGGTGVALFLAALGAHTGEAGWTSLATRALAGELRHGRARGGLPVWPERADAGNRYWSPHVGFGAAGLAAVAARVAAQTGDDGLRARAEWCGSGLRFRWTNKLWQDMGYAGYGETLLDLHYLTGDDVYREHALRIAEILLTARVRTRMGVAFPGLGLTRVSSDWGYGASGIALFLHRVAHGGPRAFFPDAILPPHPAAGAPPASPVRMAA